jgi:hypothetical protein
MKTIVTHLKNIKLLALLAILLLSRLQSTAQSGGPQESMRISLYQLLSTGTTNLADGNLTNYDNSFSNSIGDDAIKMNNFGENFGILRDATKLAIEQRRKIYDADTTFLVMWNMQIRSYRLIITTYNLEHPGLQGYFEDAFLHTSTPLALNSINTIDFAVNSTAGSYASNRFMITFRNPTLVPLATTFTGFTGRLNNNKIDLQWIINNESAMSAYEVQRSVDGSNFTTISSQAAINTPGSRTYISSDATYLKGANYYRIRAIGLNGSAQYSNILNISGGARMQDIGIYPNPVVNKKMNMVFSVQTSGRYSLNLYSTSGSIIPLTPVEVMSGQTNLMVLLPRSLASGVYRVLIVSPDNITTVKTITVL